MSPNFSHTLKNAGNTVTFFGSLSIQGGYTYGYTYDSTMEVVEDFLNSYTMGTHNLLF